MCVFNTPGQSRTSQPAVKISRVISTQTARKFSRNEQTVTGRSHYSVLRGNARNRLSETVPLTLATPTYRIFMVALGVTLSYALLEPGTHKGFSSAGSVRTPSRVGKGWNPTGPTLSRPLFGTASRS